MRPTQPKGKTLKGITREMVWKAYQSVKRNRGAAGVDKVSLEEFDKDLDKNLYKIWNQMASGSYFPPPVKAVPIPKKDGGTRVLGVPTVRDRVAQTVVAQFIEPKLEPLFHPDSYGYRPRKSALDAVGQVRKRCWEYDWTLEFDIRGLFDNINHDLLMNVVRNHIQDKWVLLYLERWLKAPMSQNGKVVDRTKGVGTPQGSCVSPILSNLFLHYAFDMWMARTCPKSPFVRYADDGVIQCHTKQEAVNVRNALENRFKEVGLEIHPKKTHIVYCKKSGRTSLKGEKVTFDFLGYTFKPREAVNKRTGQHFGSYLPGVSSKAKKAMNKKIRDANVRRSSHLSVDEIAKKWNPILRGWFNYYGRYTPSAFYVVLSRFNGVLARWARRTLKSLRGSMRRAYEWIKGFVKANPYLFWHWMYVSP